MKRLILLLALFGLAQAQPYLAAGGFGRPSRIAGTSTTTDVALAMEGGVVYAYWAGDEGIFREALSGPGGGQSELVVENPYIRRVMAATVEGSVALAWIDRSNVTGRSRHVLRWRGETRTVLEAAAARPFAIGAGPRGPVALLTVHRKGEDVLSLTPWKGQPHEIATSEFSIEKPVVTVDARGAMHIAWLEGLRSVQASGLIEVGWHAKYRRIAANGTPGPVRTLGPSQEPGLTQGIRIGMVAGQPQVMWDLLDKAAGKAGLAVAAPGGPVRLISPGGSPVGVWDGFAYWSQGDSLRRRALGEGEEQGAAVNVLWSPTPIERAAGETAGGELYLLWYGPTPGVLGADFALFAADTRTPFVPGWKDRIAARLELNPWNFWAALGGQVLGSLFISVAAAMISLPVFWLLGLLLGGRGAGQGVLLSVGVVLVLCIVMYVRSGILPAGPLQLGASLLVAAGIAYALTRKANAERQSQALLGALATTFMLVALLGFLNFQRWLSLWNGLSG